MIEAKTLKILDVADKLMHTLVGPIIGQNFGAGQHDRVRGTFRDAMIFTALVVVFVAGVLFVIREPIAALFDADGITKELVFLFCGPLALAFFFNGVIFVGNAAFNNLGHPFYSTWINWGRHTLGTIPFVILGGMWFGAPGILFGQALGGVIFAGLTLILVRQVLSKEASGEVHHEPFARQARLFQILHHRR